MQAEEAPSTRLAAAALQAAAQAEEAEGSAGGRSEEPALDRLPPAIAALLPRRPYTGECPGSPSRSANSACVISARHLNSLKVLAVCARMATVGVPCCVAERAQTVC